jgi:lysozyme
MAQPTIRLGSTGSDVSAWQGAIGVPADGVFGPQTVAATKAWQAGHGVTADGVVGPATWPTVDVPTTMPAAHDGWTLGIDVSACQGVIDWAAVRAQGVRFAFIKATDGTCAVDSKWAVNSSGAQAADMAFGSYHVLEPGTDPTAQAQHYLSIAKGIGALPPVLDFELAKGLSAASALARAAAFLDAVEQAWGKRALVYVCPGFISQLAALAGDAGTASLQALAERPLWVAHYGVASPKVPSPWTDWTLWQFAGDGGYRMPNGIVVDVDWIQGGLSALRK